MINIRKKDKNSKIKNKKITTSDLGMFDGTEWKSFSLGEINAVCSESETVIWYGKSDGVYRLKLPLEL